jgi:hypothetical protein
VGAAAPEQAVFKFGAILLDCREAVKESETADQPCLIVNDLKLGETRGQIGLWVGADTDGYFSNLTVK